MIDKLASLTEFLWGGPLLVLMLGTGLYLTIRTGFFQLHIGYIYRNTIGTIFGKNAKEIKGEGNLKSFQCISTVLAGTVGSGTIAGVASAIAIGGPGSLFWMWCISFVGMLTKMTEVTLAVNYRSKDEKGEYYGGPMYYIQKGLGEKYKFLSKFYSIALLILVITDATFVQPNTLATSVHAVFGVPVLVTGIIAVTTSFFIIIGGVEKIGEFCGRIIPFMCMIYVIVALGVVIVTFRGIPEAFGLIFQYAFSPAPAVGGFVGSSVMMAMSKGAARGVFSNEAGMGTSTAIHSTVITDHPVRQGMWGTIEVFVISFLVTNLTGFAIICTGYWNTGLTGAPLTIAAFHSVWGNFGTILVGLAIATFTYSATLGSFIKYKTSIHYLFGKKAQKYLQWLYFVPPIIAVTLDTEFIWTMADIATCFLVIPNTIAILALSPVFIKLFKEFRKMEP